MEEDKEFQNNSLKNIINILKKSLSYSTLLMSKKEISNYIESKLVATSQVAI